jgi:hypothetical protein
VDLVAADSAAVVVQLLHQHRLLNRSAVAVDLVAADSAAVVVQLLHRLQFLVQVEVDSVAADTLIRLQFVHFPVRAAAGDSIQAQSAQLQFIIQVRSVQFMAVPVQVRFVTQVQVPARFMVPQAPSVQFMAVPVRLVQFMAVPVQVRSVQFMAVPVQVRSVQFMAVPVQVRSVQFMVSQAPSVQAQGMVSLVAVNRFLREIAMDVKVVEMTKRESIGATRSINVVAA